LRTKPFSLFLRHCQEVEPRYYCSVLPKLEDILKVVGVSAETLDRVRLGRGVVGKATLAIIGAFVVLGIIAWGLKGLAIPLLIVAAFVVILFVVYLVGVVRFANQNPAAALLEGAELLTWQQLAAKTIPNPPDSNVAIPEPDVPQLTAPPPDEDESDV